jgi:hypothetical protein
MLVAVEKRVKMAVERGFEWPRWNSPLQRLLPIVGCRLTGNSIDFESTVVHDRFLTTLPSRPPSMTPADSNPHATWQPTSVTHAKPRRPHRQVFPFNIQ